MKSNTHQTIKSLNRSLGLKEFEVRQQPEEQKNIETEDPSSIRILLVEDNVAIRILIQALLEKTPYIVDTAENGEVAVIKFKANQYDLILMDIEMPVMNGYTATTKIREWESENQSERKPIIALTAHALAEYTKKSIDVGCNAHLTKPIKKKDLLSIIKKYAFRSDP